MYAGDDVSPVWLSSFLAVVDHGSFTAAAAATHRSQPRVSAHVAALERRVGARLLDRDARRTSLTEAGHQLLPHARAALTEIRAGISSVGSLTGELQGTVTVGSFAGPSGVVLAPLIKRFCRTYPRVVVDLREGTPHWLEEAASTFAVDLALRTADVPMLYRLRSAHLLTERIVLAVPEDVGDLGGERGRLSLLDGAAVVVTGAPAEGWTDFTDRLSACGVTPSSITTVTHPTTVIALVRAGMGLGLLGEMGATVSAFEGVRLLSLPLEVWTREIRVHWNDRRRLDSATRRFLGDLLNSGSRPPQH